MKLAGLVGRVRHLEVPKEEREDEPDAEAHEPGEVDGGVRLGERVHAGDEARAREERAEAGTTVSSLNVFLLCASPFREGPIPARLPCRGLRCQYLFCS